jgi:endonuclease/exonuclease/phosphatase family metal-dependent hydrolase
MPPGDDGGVEADDGGFDDGGVVDSGANDDAGSRDGGIRFDGGLADAAVDAGMRLDAGSPLDGGFDGGRVPDAGGLDAGGLLDGGRVVIRLAAANLTSGNAQSWDLGHGLRILQAVAPDVVGIQEFNVGMNAPAELATFSDSLVDGGAFWFRGSGQIPNGIISRYPIVVSGEWPDALAPNREFAYARIDIPGPVDLWVISVHLLTSNASQRNSEAVQLVSHIRSNVPQGDYVAVVGDFNTDSRTESCFSTLSSVISTSSPFPADAMGNSNTNAARTKPYDWVLVDPGLRSFTVPTVVSNQSFPAGLVFDTRVFVPLPAPALMTDSDAPNMQHMAVIRDFLVGP